jgi:hypothetical protein
MNQIHIRAVAFQEEGVWVVQGIEYDIVAHTDDPSKVPDVFIRAVIENACINTRLDRDALKGIKPAPEHFKDMFDTALTELRPVTLPPYLPVASFDIRLARHAH